MGNTLSEIYVVSARPEFHELVRKLTGLLADGATVTVLEPRLVATADVADGAVVVVDGEAPGRDDTAAILVSRGLRVVTFDGGRGGYGAGEAVTGSRQESSIYSLTPRETEIAILMARGLTNREIARRLDLALPTVKNHVHVVLRKLGLKRRSRVALKFLQQRDSSEQG